MAKKEINVRSYLIYVIFGSALSAILLTVRYTCMDNEDSSFVGSYCTSDNYMRTVISSILTICVYFIGLAFGDTIDSLEKKIDQIYYNPSHE